MNFALVGLGSNIAPEANLCAALIRLRELFPVPRTSSVYRSSPVGFTAQPDFLNAAALIETALEPNYFVTEILKSVEEQLGRMRDQNRHGPRTIDLDLLLWLEENMVALHEPQPHPALLKEAYAVIPAAEVLPNVRHPTDGRTLSELAEAVVKKDLVRINLNLAGGSL